jgi:hypothetical protein
MLAYLTAESFSAHKIALLVVLQMGRRIVADTL